MGERDIKADGIYLHLAPQHGIVGGRKGIISSGACVSPCWRIESNLLLPGSLEGVGSNYATLLFEDEGVRSMMQQGP